MLFRVAGEPFEIGEDDAHVPRSGERLVQVEGAEALLVPLGSRSQPDHEERTEHQHVPLPPGELPVARPGDDHHRLREECEGEREREHEALGTPPVQAHVAERRDAVQPDADCGQHELPAVELLRLEWPVERRELRKRDDGPDRHDSEETGQQQASVPDDAPGSLCAKLDRRRGGEGAGHDEPERRRELEAGVGAEQDGRGRQRVQAEEARAGDEGERDEEEPRVPASARCGADRPAECCGQHRRPQDEPEVGLLVLPADVHLRSCEKDREQRQWCDDDGEPGAGVHGGRFRLKPDVTRR